MDKTKGEGGSKGGRRVGLGWGRGVGRKCRQLYSNNNKITLKKKNDSESLGLNKWANGVDIKMRSTLGETGVVG